jgi:sRNA-binding carbon storage regulator CsrA
MLVISRCVNDSLVIELSEEADPTMTVAALFANGPIRITLLALTKSRFKLGITAPGELFIWRKDGGFDNNDASLKNGKRLLPRGSVD